MRQVNSRQEKEMAMGHSTSRLLGVLFVLALAANVRDATAEIYTWTQTTGGTYAWDTGEDWSGGLAPDPVSGDTVDLSTVNIAGNMTLTLDADRTATTWKFGDTSGTENWIVDAGSPAGKLMLAGSTPTITVNQNTTTINAIVDGTSLNKSGGGTLVLTGANTYTGLTRINSGTLSIDSIQNAGVSSPLGAYPTTAASGLVLYGGTLKYTGSTASSDRGLSIGGDWGQGTVNVATPGASLTLGNLTRYDAKDNRLNVSGGAGSSLKLTSVTNNNNIYFTNSIALTIDSITGIGVLEKNGTSVMYLNGVNTSYSGNIRLTQGQLNISNDNNLGTGPLSFDGGTLQFAAGSDVTLAAGRSVTMNSGKTSSVDTSLASGTIASVLSGSGNLTKIGDNALTLNAANIFTGTTKVTGGSLKLGVANALQFSVYDTTSSNGTTIGLDVNGFAAPTLGGLSGSVNLASAIVGYSGVTGLTLNPQSGSLTYSGGIADGATGMTVTKTGGGTQILSGVNAYTGATTVNAGLLRITGSTSASSAVSVTGGSIGGSGNGTTTGIIGGTVTLSGAGGVDLRDAAIGTLTLGGDLAIDGAAAANFLYFDLANNGTTTDKIVVGGNTTVSTTGAAVISLNQIGSRIQDGTYTLIQGTGTIPTATDFSLAAGKAFGMNFSLDVSGSNLQLTTARLASGPAAAFWAGGTDENWTTAGNWNTDATSGTSTAEGAPSYNTNVTFHTTNPAAGNLSNTMDADFDINSLTFAADATSPVAISGTNKTLTIEGSSGITVATPTSGTIEHTISANVGLAANQTWTVNPSATLTVSGNVTDFGGGRTLTKAGTGTLNLNGDTTVGSLQIAYNTSASAGTVVVGSGGSLSVGSGPVSNFYVGWGSGNNANGAGTLDASAASSFTANVGNFMVGGTCGGNGTVKLGADNMITASTQFGIEKGSWGGPNGYGTVTTAADSTTTIHTPIMYLGNDIPNGTTGGWGKFTLGSGGTLNLDGINGGRTDLSISWFWSGNGSSESTPSLMDLSGGAANLKLSSLVVGRREAGGGSGNYGIMTLGTSFSNHLDISGPGNVVLVGYCSGSGTGEGTLTLANLDATSAITSTANSTAILLGSKVSTGPANGTLNLNGGTLTITTTGTAIGGGGGTSNLNLDGVTLKAGASSTTWLQGLTAAKIKSGGVTFDTAGYDITIAQALLTNTVSLGGGLTKAGNGILTLTGANTYTGATNVNGGTFKLDAGGSIASALINVGGSGIFDVSTVTGGYTLASGKTLNGSGAVTGDVIADSDSLLAPGDGVSGGTLTLCNGLTLGTGANVQVSNPGSSVVQVNGVYTDDLGVHSLLGGGTMTLNQVSTFLHWSGATPAGMVTGQQSNWTVPAAGGVKNWIGSLSENWTNAGNWDGYAGEVWADTSAKTLSVKCTAPGVVPFALSDVVINPSTSGITVTGPASEAVAINSLQVGGANNSSPTLTLGAASFNVTGAVSVVSNGTLNAIDGGLVAATLNVSSAGAAATLGNASGNITAANVSAGTLTVNAGIVGTADLSGTGSLAGSAAVNQVNVTGGAPAFSGNATVMTVTGGGVTTTGGTIGAFNSNTGAVSSTIGGGTTVTTANVNAGTVNFNSTQANGTLALPAGSTGTVIVGSGAKVATADFSAGAGTVTANYPLTITNQIKLAGGTTATTDGPAFTAQSVSGSNIADNAAARTFTISGGTMTLAALSAPSVTGISYAQITNDADSGISSADTYTHALDFGSSGAATVNGVAFANDVNVSAGGRTNSGTRTYGPQVHGGNTPPVVSGSVASIFTDMRYDGPDGGYIELTGLTVGQWYDVRLYDRAWDYGGSVRTFYAGYDVGSNGTLEYTTPKIDQNRGNLTPPGMSGNVSWAMSCVYQADSSGKMKVIIDLASDQSGTYHLYGLTNRAVPSGSGLINFPNTNIAATASSTLDLGASSADHTLGDMMLSGADTALTISNANSVSFKNIIATDTS